MGVLRPAWQDLLDPSKAGWWGGRLDRRDYPVGTAVLEFIAATDETNIEDQMAMLKDRPGAMQVEEEVSLRLLRHYASSVRHHQYHDTDVVTVRVEPVVSL